jgi:hypothetical protein
MYTIWIHIGSQQLMLDICTPQDDPLRVETCSVYKLYNKTNVDTVVSILFYFRCVHWPQFTGPRTVPGTQTVYPGTSRYEDGVATSDQDRHRGLLLYLGYLQTLGKIFPSSNSTQFLLGKFIVKRRRVAKRWLRKVRSLLR